MRKWILLLLAALTLAIVLMSARDRTSPRRAHAPSTTAAATGAGGPRATLPAHRRWDTGLHRTYALELTTRLAGDAQPIEIRVRGDWQVTVVDGGEEHATLRVQLGSPAVSSGGQSAPPDMIGEMARPWFVELDGEGRLEAAWFEHGVGRASRDLLKTVAAYLQYGPPGGDAQRVEQDSTGTYQAEYASSGSHELTRTKAHYISIVTARGPVAPRDVGGPDVKASGARFELDEEGWPARVTVDEQLAVAVPESTQRYAATVALRAERTDAGRRGDLAGAFAAARPGLRRYAPLAEAPDARDVAADLDRQQLGGADYRQLVDELRGARDPHAEVAVQRRLRALFALHPGEARRAAELLRGRGLSDSGKQTVIAALAAAGTPEAQQVLVDSLGEPSTTELRQQTLSSLGMTPAPTAETLGALRAIAEAPAEAADRHTALLAFGNAARHGDEDAVAWLLERLQSASTSGDVAIYLRALANTRDPRALPAIVERLRSNEPEIRGAAVSALRLIDEPTVDGLIGKVLLGDGDGRVRSEAVFAATYRPLDPMLPVLEGALQRDPEAYVRMRVVELLGQRRRESAACDPLLARTAQHDGDPEVRRAAAQALRS